MVANRHPRNIDQRIENPNPLPTVRRPKASGPPANAKYSTQTISDADRAADRQPEIPTEIHSGDNHTYAERPDVNNAQRLFESVLAKVCNLLR